ncbi:unnamed protein product [Heligmosomoides polygyrus]|uniref:APH domain-containing protein n=1 Tax=Heligmosomoides polygyrus TaxID=6339 RepID=A0A183GN87_HELPZ|nr:unnamed protein product [Heligmosomoides polygyrus]
MLFFPQPSPTGYKAVSAHIPGKHMMRHRFFASGTVPETGKNSIRPLAFTGVDRRRIVAEVALSRFVEHEVAVPDLVEFCNGTNILIFVDPHQFVIKLFSRMATSTANEVSSQAAYDASLLCEQDLFA